MRLKQATFTVEYGDGQTEDVDSHNVIGNEMSSLESRHDGLDYTLVYQCQEDNQTYAEDRHEDQETADSWDDVSNYAIEDADPCERCEVDYGILNRVVLDRIEVNNPNAEINTIHINI
jgi:hypothetical protein